MNQPVADLEQRRQAISPDGSFIVQAPAGSGKTELLIQRYLRLLAIVDAPEEIVAITFTKKAAAEMRGRIIAALENITSEQAVEDEAATQTRELAKQAWVRNQKYDWQLENNPGRLRIQTIDSLCAALTRQMPVLSRFGAQPETIEDAAELYKEAAAATLAELESGQGWSDAIAVLLTHLDNNLPRVRDMLASMLARRDQWLRHVAGGINREELESALKHVVESTLRVTRESFPEKFEQDFTECLQFAAKNLEWKQTEFNGLPGTTAEDLPVWQSIVELFLTQNNDWRKQVNKNQGFPAGAANKDMKDGIQSLISHLSIQDGLLRQFIEVRNLPPVRYTENEWQVVKALCELLILSDAQLRVLFAERNQVDFTGITQAAIQALGEPDNPTDLALHLDYRIKHLLVDEYQDISINQYKLLEQLTAGWSADDGHTLFLVGDPMQSIYRFREAEVGLFLNTWKQQRLGQVAITPLTITVNFRSRQGIVQWVNETFSQILPQSADVGRGAVSYTPAVAYHDHSDTSVILHPIIGRDDQKEAEIVLKEIQSTRGGTTAVLVRSRRHLQKIVPVLKQAGLRFRAVEIEELGQQASIQDLIALTRALHHFADRVAWLAILRAPWGGLTLADLLVLAGDAKHKTIWECMQDETRVEKMSQEGRVRLNNIRTILGVAFQRRQRLDMSRWVQSVWMKLGGPATLNDITDLENTRTFFELLVQFEEGGDLKDRDEFIAQVSSLYAAPDINADQSLQIMTIHKAKGLEFDTVILPGLARKSRGDEAQLLLWSENPHRDHQDLLLAPVREAGEQESPTYHFLKNLEKEKQAYEDGRLLYVAATRAKQRLHLIGNVEVKANKGEPELASPLSSSLLAQLWPAVEADFQAAFEHYQNQGEQTEQESLVVSNTLKRLTLSWQLPSPPVAVTWKGGESAEVVGTDTKNIEFEWAGEAIKHIGTVVHQVIRWIAEEGINSWDENRIQSKANYYRWSLEQLGVPEAELGWASKRVEDALIKLVRDERGNWILANHEEQYNEYALTGVYSGKIVNIIIDRTFVDETGTRWVIDYKTSRHEGPDLDTFLDREQERYREQLEKYGAIMQTLDNRPVKLGLYFPLLQGWREWKFDQ